MSHDPKHPIVLDDLVAVYTLDVNVPPEHVRAMAEELLRRRKRDRHESRRAEQIKKLRWGIENLLRKVETIEEYIEANEAQLALPVAAEPES